MNTQSITLDDLKQLLLEHCFLQLSLAEIDPRRPLFGANGLGLDSIDALQLSVALEKHLGPSAAIPPSEARQILHTLETLHKWVQSRPTASS